MIDPFRFDEGFSGGDEPWITGLGIVLLVVLVALVVGALAWSS